MRLATVLSSSQRSTARTLAFSADLLWTNIGPIEELISHAVLAGLIVERLGLFARPSYVRNCRT